MGSIFAQLQALSTMSADNTIVKSRKQLNEIVQIFRARQEYMEELVSFGLFTRDIEVQTLLECDSFMVQPDLSITLLPEELRHESLGFCKASHFVFEGRFVYPVKDTKGDVMGFVGYDKFSQLKYLDSVNYGYRAKTYSMWGVEKIEEYYKSTEPVYFTEGVVCALYLRQCKLQALATLGSNISAYCVEIIRRFGMRAIVVCDADEAGTKCKNNLKRYLPYLRCVQSTVAKDIDDSRKVNVEFVNELRKLKDPFYRSKLFV